MLPARRHWPSGREGGGEGAPSQKTCRSPTPEPLAEGGFVFRRTLAGLVALAFLAVAGAASSSGRALPQRIVSLSPTATEDLFAIGAGKQVIAVDSYSTYPASAPHSKLSAYTPNAEAIAAYKPDLVVISFDSSHIKEALAKLHIPVLME